MLKNKIIVACCTGVVTMSSVVASVCENIEAPIAQTTPTERFVIHEDAPVITDRGTHLMWTRCQLKLERVEDVDYFKVDWEAEIDRCATLTNFNQFTWKEALNINAASLEEQMPLYSGWRLPNIKELSSIVERRCSDPAMNDELFRGGNMGRFWTSTPASGNEIWVVNFSNGTEGTVPLLRKEPFVRLVRDITPSE